MQISAIIEKVACTANMNRDTVIAAGIQAFLRDRKKDILLEKMKLLSRYGTATKEALEKKIENGEVVEHPAWEDLILVENLETAENVTEPFEDEWGNDNGRKRENIY